jgi:Big-like domain-containing protein/multicopper oxidase
MASFARRHRLGTALLLGLPLAYGVGLFMVAIHAIEGAHEHGEPLLVVHWLRDSTLALPGVLTAVWVAVTLASRLLVAYPGSSRRLARALVASLAALGTSAAMGLGNPVHTWLFSAHEGHELPFVVHVTRDTLLALFAAMPIALAVAFFLLPRRQLVLRPLEAAPALLRREAHAFRAAPRRRLGLAGMVGLTVAALMSVGGADSVQAADLGPCAPGAPLKQFSIQALDVDIPVNRFGDHDPNGKMYVLSSKVADVRAEEQSRVISVGLREDPIQPLVIRANQGDCVEISYTNNATGGSFGLHIDGVAYDTADSGDSIGRNPSSEVATGSTRVFRYWIANDRRLEGSHYMHPGPGFRNAVTHGLFGALTVEPKGSRYANPNTGEIVADPQTDSGWERTIISGGSGKAFREAVQVWHEIGHENDRAAVLDAQGQQLPLIDPTTKAYRPGTRAINYRSEPFMHRLERAGLQKSLTYSSYTFGDPPTAWPRGYLGDPTKIRIVHAGTEIFHVFHLHGGGDRWRFNPIADTTYAYDDTGLNKKPKTQHSPSARLDSQSLGPGESYNFEIEGGAGGVQQAAGDFLFHCHIAHHYFAGMWAFWRVYDTKQPDFAALPDRAPPPNPVDSSGLLGKKMADGTTLTAATIDDWIRPQLPPAGVTRSDQDASVWNWSVDRSNPTAPVFLGEPEDTSAAFPDRIAAVPGHPGSYVGDTFVGSRPKILFNPTNGRPAYPLLRPHIGRRPPFSGNGHSGAPWLGEQGGSAPSGGVDPWANRADAICPSGAPARKFNVVSVEVPIQVTAAGGTDPDGAIFVLARDKAAVRAGTKPREPLALRGNIGDCTAITLTSEQTDARALNGFQKTNMHIHHVQFDPQASDGVISGMSYEQSVRPYQLEDPTIAAAASTGDTVLRLSSVAKFQPGVWIGIGLGTEEIEIRQIASIDAGALTVTLTKPLSAAHPVGQWAGTEFVQYRWYPDVALDNIFWHDHVDGIHGWGHGMVGQFIVEPAGSTYHDPRTGAEVASGTIVDIRTSNPLAPGLVEGSFRELALWQIDENPVTDSTLNLRAAPFADRLADNGDPSLLFSSYTHGDPNTPLPRAYPGDPFVIRLLNVSGGVDTIHVDGHRFFVENRYLDPNGKPESSPVNTYHAGISERFSLMLEGGAGGALRKPGDYLYMNGIGRRTREGAWGLIRVLGGAVPDLQPLPGRPTPGGSGALPEATGGRPPASTGPGDPCPAGATVRSFDVSAVDLRRARGGPQAAFVPTANAAAAQFGSLQPEPLVLHAAEGECLEVNFTNRRVGARASFHVAALQNDMGSSGVNVGFNEEQTVAPGISRTYRYYVDTAKVESALITDFGGTPVVPDPLTGVAPVDVDTGPLGLYGSVSIAPAGAAFTDPVSGAPKDVGSQVDVHVPGTPGYRDFTLLLQENDAQIGASAMPYKEFVGGRALVNYRSAPRTDGANAFSSLVNGDPETPILRAYRGDPMRVHALVAPGSEQMHVFSLGGLSWPNDPYVYNSEEKDSLGLGPWQKIDAHVIGGAGGRGASAGDYFYGDLRRPFSLAGMWGLLRVLSDSHACPIRPLDGLTCTGGPPPIPEAPVLAHGSDTGASATDGVTKIATPTVSGKADPGSSAIVYVDGSALPMVTVDADGFYSLTTPTLAEGSHSLAAVAVDSAGNPSLPSAERRIVIDTQAPDRPAAPALAAASDSGVLEDGLTKDATPTFDGSAEPDATVTLVIDGSIRAQRASSAAGRYRLTSDPLGHGGHSVAVGATDLAGNLSRLSHRASMLIDLRAPFVRRLSVSPGAFVPGPRALTRIRFLVAEAATVNVRIEGKGFVRRFPTVSTKSAKTLRFVWNGKTAHARLAPAGFYRIVIVTVDRAGNRAVSRDRRVHVNR